MLIELDKQLTDTKNRLQVKQSTLDSLQHAKQSFNEEQSRIRTLKAKMLEEEADVKKLEGLNITALFQTVLGKKDRQLEIERQEFLAAKLKYDECAESIATLNGEIEYLENQLRDSGDVELIYQTLLAKKEAILVQSNHRNVHRILAISEEIGSLKSRIQILSQALRTGSEALTELDNIISALNEAGNWGALDLLGGGIISTAFKHSSIDDAKASVHKTQQLIRRFQIELVSVQDIVPIDINIGSFWTFADYFFDGLIADWVVLSKLENSYKNAREAKRQLENILRSLLAELKNLKKQMSDLTIEHNKVVSRVMCEIVHAQILKEWEVVAYFSYRV